MVEGSQKVENGRDEFFDDSIILRFCNGRKWNMELILKDLVYHLEWR